MPSLWVSSRVSTPVLIMGHQINPTSSTFYTIPSGTPQNCHGHGKLGPADQTVAPGGIMTVKWVVWGSGWVLALEKIAGTTQGASLLPGKDGVRWSWGVCIGLLPETGKPSAKFSESGTPVFCALWVPRSQALDCAWSLFSSSLAVTCWVSHFSLEWIPSFFLGLVLYLVHVTFAFLLEQLHYKVLRWSSSSPWVSHTYDHRANSPTGFRC